jgi:hypothetical protein
MDVVIEGSCEDVNNGAISGIAATEVGSLTPADSVTVGRAAGGVEDDSDELITAVSIVSELVGAILAGGNVGVATIWVGAAAGSLDCGAALEVDCAGAGAGAGAGGGSRIASGEDVASDMRTALPVPIAEDTAACDVGTGTTTDASTEEDGVEGAGAGGGGGGGGGGG